VRFLLNLLSLRTSALGLCLRIPRSDHNTSLTQPGLEVRDTVLCSVLAHILPVAGLPLRPRTPRRFVSIPWERTASFPKSHESISLMVHAQQRQN